jgi:hypothetical protein
LREREEVDTLSELVKAVKVGDSNKNYKLNGSMSTRATSIFKDSKCCKSPAQPTSMFLSLQESYGP